MKFQNNAHPEGPRDSFGGCLWHESYLSQRDAFPKESFGLASTTHRHPKVSNRSLAYPKDSSPKVPGTPLEDALGIGKVKTPKKFIIEQLGISRSTLYRELSKGILRRSPSDLRGKRNSSKTGIYSKGVPWTGLKEPSLYVMNARNDLVEQGNSARQRKRKSLNGSSKNNGRPNKSSDIAKNKAQRTPSENKYGKS